MKKILKNYALTILIMLLLLSPLLLHFGRLMKIENNYQSSGVSFKQTSTESARITLDTLNIDTSLPGNGNHALTFSAPFGMLFQDTAYNDCSFSQDDELTCDFVSWSHNFFRERIVTLFVNGKEYSAKMKTWQLTLLYLSAIKQNELQSQFQADSGRKLTFFSAKSALKTLDKTLFDKGIHKAYNYPYDRRMVKLTLALCLIFLVPIGILLLSVLSLLSDHIKYHIWLKSYNQEKIQSWDKIAGTLPQFVSLRDAGLYDPIPQFRRQKLRHRILEMFKPERQKK